MNIKLIQILQQFKKVINRIQKYLFNNLYKNLMKLILKMKKQIIKII